MINNIGVFKDYSDGTLKSVFETDDKRIIEMSLLFNKENMDVVCVPTHHFCNLGCKMCHLTNNKLNKKMVCIDSDVFIECLFRTLTKDERRITDKDNLLISFMGVGEPLMNLNLIKNVFLYESEIKKKLGYKTVGYAISTMMPVKDIKELTNMVNDLSIPLKLHFSMHTPIDVERFKLIPSTKVSVEEALSNLVYYKNIIQSNERIMSEYIKLHRTDNPVEIHYTLIKDVNDSEQELNLLCNLLNKYQIPIKFIKFNPTNTLERSLSEDMWINVLKQELPLLRVKRYSPPGREVGSSCGEFTKHYYHEEIETKEEKDDFERWKELHLIR